MDGAIQIEQSTGGAIEVSVRRAKAANKKRVHGKYLKRAWLSVGHYGQFYTASVIKINSDFGTLMFGH
jgi:hypothetical protein